LKGRLTLAEAATTHPDGTTSILRSGINSAWGTLPVGFEGAIVVRIEGDIGDKGGHRFDLRCMDADGKDAMPTLQGGFDFPPEGGVMNFVMSFQMQFPRHAKYSFVLRVDNIQMDSWQVTISENQAAPGGKQ
jgi:hypothetical protein